MSLPVVNSNPYPMLGYQAYNGTLASGSAEHDFFSDAGRFGTAGQILNTGGGVLSFSVLSGEDSNDPIAKTYGVEVSLLPRTGWGLDGLQVQKIRVTHVSGTPSYQIGLK